MKTFFKVIGVGAFFYALTLYSNTKTREAIAQEKDSLWHYYNTTIEERAEINKYINSLKQNKK